MQDTSKRINSLVPGTATDLPGELYKQAKHNGHSDVHRNNETTVENDEEDGAEGPEMPPYEDEGDDEEGRFFGGGVNRDTARAIAFLDEVDGDEEIVGSLASARHHTFLHVFLVFNRSLLTIVEARKDRCRVGPAPRTFIREEALCKRHITSQARRRRQQVHGQ